MNLAPTSVRTGHLRGFTLIELLVVIAIIGILSSVVLASLNTARNKGADAAIKSNLSAARAEAEIYYDTVGTYGTAGGGTGVCSTSGANVIGDSIQAAITASGGSDASATVANRCFVSTGGAGWAASVHLKSETARYCVDSTGFAATTSATITIGTSDVSCL